MINSNQAFKLMLNNANIGDINQAVTKTAEIGLSEVRVKTGSRRKALALARILNEEYGFRAKSHGNSGDCDVNW